MKPREIDAEEEGNKGYALGQVVALQEAAAILLDDAASWFKNGNDAMAQNYRMTAQRLSNIASGRRAEYDKKYHPETVKP
jgi:hypothetical protein